MAGNGFAKPSGLCFSPLFHLGSSHTNTCQRLGRAASPNYSAKVKVEQGKPHICEIFGMANNCKKFREPFYSIELALTQNSAEALCPWVR